MPNLWHLLPMLYHLSFPDKTQPTQLTRIIFCNWHLSNIGINIWHCQTVIWVICVGWFSVYVAKVVEHWQSKQKFFGSTCRLGTFSLSWRNYKSCHFFLNMIAHNSHFNWSLFTCTLLCWAILKNKLPLPKVYLSEFASWVVC